MVHLAIERHGRDLSRCVDDCFRPGISRGLLEVSNTLNSENISATGNQGSNQLHLFQGDDPLDKWPGFKFAILIVRRLGTSFDQFVQNIRRHPR